MELCIDHMIHVEQPFISHLYIIFINCRLMQADQSPYFSYFFLLFDPEPYFSLFFKETALLSLLFGVSCCQIE